MPDVKKITNAPSDLTKIIWLLTAPWKLGIGEDPEWGRRPIGQLHLQSAIHELAAQIADKEIQKSIQTAAAKGMEQSVRSMGR